MTDQPRSVITDNHTGVDRPACRQTDGQDSQQPLNLCNNASDLYATQTQTHTERERERERVSSCPLQFTRLQYSQ